MENVGRYIATVLLWPSRHKDRVKDPREQRRLSAYHEPLTADLRRFDHLPRAQHWCKTVVANKHRATRWWWIDEDTPGGRIEVVNTLFDWLRYTDAEAKRIEDAMLTTRIVTRQVHLKPGLVAQVDALASSR